MNLLKETIRTLQDYGKTPQNVCWCGSREGVWFTWEEFVEMAKDVEYDSEWEDGARVAIDLLIVGDDWWLERNLDDDGGWIFEELPKKRKEHKTGLKLMAGEQGWFLDLETINRRQQ